ncbi:MAG: hypothetical protein KBD06_04660 [Candidatus Pacebacteria bacterium]|nr:hypothetical protein [Candidatus Paceibacterota bacterium]
MKYTTISGLIATHKKAPFHGTIWIDKKTGLIAKVMKRKDPNADHMYGDEFLIFAGFSDIHIHAREDKTTLQCYKEDYKTASRAALHGGVVCACTMPNTPETVVTLPRFNWHRNRVKRIRHPVTMLNYLGIDKNTRPIGKPGEYMYKLYFGKSVGDLTVMYGEELDEILARYRGHHISFHVEYEPIVQASARGKTHADRRPVAAVNEGLLILLPLIKKYKIKAKLCHWSTGSTSFKMIDDYRKQGCDIVLEVSPLHLFFHTGMTDHDPSWWLKIQMNPAVQAEQHQKDLIRGLREGFIQFIATDHAPHTLEEKYSAFKRFADDYPGKSVIEIAELVRAKDEKLFLATCEENNHSGAPWLDTYALVCTWLMKVHKFTAQDIARVSAYNPGRFVNRYLKTQFKKQNFGKGFGEIEKGFMGSLTVLNTKKETLVRREDLQTKVGWSALEGMTLPGAVEAVFIRGNKY